MKPETPYSRFENTISPNYNELKNFKTPQVLPKGETSEMILSQTKASLHNFLANLKKGSTMNDILKENKKKQLMPEMNNLSRISNKKYPDDDQGIVESYLKLSKLYNKTKITKAIQSC